MLEGTAGLFVLERRVSEVEREHLLFFLVTFADRLGT